jgi:ankyrin repeat protein
MYQATIARIEDQDRTSSFLAFRIFRWLSFAKRPLTAQELQHALATEESATSFDEENMVDTNMLVSVCGGLVVITPVSNMVRFVHVSAQHFLKAHNAMQAADAHRDIGLTCLTYLSFDTFATGRLDKREELQRRMDEYPFLDYAARFWGVHVREEASSYLQHAATLFLGVDTKFSSCAQVMLLPKDWATSSKLTTSQDVSRLHVASYFGLLDIAAHLVANGDNVTQKDSNGRDPLFWAVEQEQWGLVDFLLQHGADINTRDRRERTPLSVISTWAHKEVVSELLQRGADPVAADRSGQTPLSLAATYGRIELLKLLAQASSNQLDIRDSFGRTPLYCAAEQGRDEVVAFLSSQVEVDVNATDNKDHTPLMSAARRGRLESVRILLRDSRIDVGLQDQTGRTAFMWAVVEGHADIVEYFLSSTNEHIRDNLELRDHSGRTLLTWASLRNKKTIQKMIEEALNK